VTAPLEGVNVVEFAEGVAGPMTGRFLGDAGADVVKVETAEGDRARGWGPVQVDGTGAAFQSINRNKRSLVVDGPDDERLKALLAKADVLIVDHLALDVDAIMAANPQLVVGVISPWGPKGPWADRPGSELEAQLAAEVTSALGRIGEEPVRLGHEHGGITAAFHASQGIVAALLAVDNVGGQRVDVSLFGSLIQMRSTLWAALSNPDEWWGFHLDSYVKPPEHGYTCKDTRIYLSAARVDNIEKLISELNMEFAREDPRWELFRKDTAGFTARHAAAVHDIWDRGLSQWTCAEAAAIVQRNGGDAFPVYTYADFIESPQVKHLGIFEEVALDSGAVLHEVRPPWQFSGTPASIRRPAPGLGQHTDEIAKELGA
jgi:crotonobetainyl-CoA:carnitine CoA-transferase CaiB-like acyl-CoA transferase